MYDGDPVAAEHDFQKLIDGDRGAGLAAAAEMAKKKHFELAALALADIKEPDVKANVIKYVLAEKTRFSPTAFAAAIHELEDENNEPAGTDGEEVAGVENTKAALATAIARWLSMPDPKLPKDPDISKPGYTSFISQAKEKAATMTEDSPY